MLLTVTAIAGIISLTDVDFSQDMAANIPSKYS
jgi:hypothetical protein